MLKFLAQGILAAKGGGSNHRRDLNYRLWQKKSGKHVCAKFFQSFLAMRAPPCTKQKIGDIEISLLSNFQLGATLGAQKKKKRKLRKRSKYL